MSDYSVNNKLIAKNTIFLYIRLIVTVIISLYTSRAFLDALGVENYGIYNVVGGFVTLLAILTNNIKSAAQRFITYALGRGDFHELQKTFLTFLSLYIIASVVILIIGECIGLSILDKVLELPENKIDAAFFVFHCSLAVFVIHLLTIPFNACIVAHEKMNFYAIISIVEAVLKLVIVYCVYATPYDTLKTYSILLCLINIVLLVVYGLYCWRHFPETKGKCQISMPIFKKVFSYSVWVTIGSSSAVIKEQGVNIVINNFFGVAINAAKGVSMQVESVVNKFALNIGTAIKPQITKSYASGDSNRAINLTFLLAKAQGILLLFFCVPLITEADYVLSIWLKEVPDYSVAFTQWVLILCIARSLEGSVVPLHLAIGKQKYIQLVCGGLMLCNLPLSFLVLELGYDPVSTVMLGIVIEFVVLFIVTLFLKNYINFPVWQFFKKSIFSVLLVGGISIVILMCIATIIPIGLVRLMFTLVLSMLLVSTLSFFIALNANEKEMVIVFIKKRIEKVRK